MTADTAAITRHDHGTHGEYLAAGSGGGTAELTWRLHGDVRHAEHTYVPESLRGQGLAAKLVDALVEDARAQGFKIAPDCSYVAAAFRRHPEWSDLRA